MDNLKKMSFADLRVMYTYIIDRLKKNDLTTKQNIHLEFLNACILQEMEKRTEDLANELVKKFIKP